MKTIIKSEHDLTGKILGIVTVLGYHGSHRSRGSMWDCQCACGTKFIQSGYILRGVSPNYSCGCTRKAKPKAPKKPYVPLVHDYTASLRSEISRQIMHGAMRAGHRFDLTRDQVKTIMDKPCQYCGTIGGNTYRKPKWGKKFRERPVYRYNGIDRIDSSLEYTVENTVPCCRPCNMFKSNRSVADLLTHSARIVVHRLTKVFPSGSGIIDFLRSYFQILP